VISWHTKYECPFGNLTGLYLWKSGLLMWTFDFAVDYTRLVMRMKLSLTIVLLLTGMLPTICWASDSSLNLTPDWRKSVYFCETTKRIYIKRNETTRKELFKFKMTVTRDGVYFSEDTFLNLNKVKFYGRYDWWDGVNTHYKTYISFNGVGNSGQGYKKGYFMYTTSDNMGFVGESPAVAAIFADCLEFND
jgi:hypothetical protein